MKKTRMASFAILIIIFFLFSTSLSFGEEMPEPGTVIDKTNIKKYAHLFPAELLPAFEDGFSGLIEPASIRVGETRVYHHHKAFLALSEENKGKYSLDADGDIIGGWERKGLPFPDLQRDDKDFLTKFMWNFNGRYRGDDRSFCPNNFSFVQRRGETIRYTGGDLMTLYYANRIVVPPTPFIETPSNVFYSQLWHFKEPAASKNMQTLSLRYMDLKKADEVYIYIPTLRRVLRGDSGQRAVPIAAGLVSLDDIGMFDGKTNEFTYKLIGEQKILAFTDASDKNATKELVRLDRMPLSFRGTLSPVNVYVIDIFGKDPVYPQSRKRIYVSKEGLLPYYAVAWDRAGVLWKVFLLAFNPLPIPGDDPIAADGETFTVDLQFGMSNLIPFKRGYDKGGLSWLDFAPPAALVKRAR